MEDSLAFSIMKSAPYWQISSPKCAQNVCTEPRLQPLSDERLDYATASTEDNARPDIQAGGFWGSSRFVTALFDVRVFNPFSESNRACPSVSSCYRRHKQEKRRMYDQRSRQVDGASFCPLVFAATGGAAPAATVFLKRLACKLAEHRDLPYSLVMNWLRCRVCFVLTRASIMCIRGSRSRMHQPLHCPLLAASEGRIPS